MKAEAATMENTAISVMEPVLDVELTESQIQPLAPPSLVPKPESVLDPTDLSDTTESEAEKHGRK